MSAFTMIYVAFLLQLFVIACFVYLLRFPARTFSDVIPYLRPDHQEELQDLLSPIKEENLLLALGRKRFLREQLKRIHLVQEILLQRAHNAKIFQEWSDTESEAATKSLNIEAKEVAIALSSVCLDHRLNTCMILGRLCVWHIRMVLVPFAGMPRISNLGKGDSFSLIESYAKVEQAAEQLASACGDECLYRLAQSLVMARQKTTDTSWITGANVLHRRF